MNCTMFVSDLHCTLDDHAKTVLFRTLSVSVGCHQLFCTQGTMLLQVVSNSTIFVLNFYCIQKNCSNTVPINTLSIPVTLYPILVNGNGNNVQNGTVLFCIDMIPCIWTRLNETVPVSTAQWHWNSGVQYRNVYSDNIGKYHLIPLCSLGYCLAAKWVSHRI